MSIYKKLAEVQCALLHKEIPKSGYNKHKGFKYHELSDLIPPIFEECMKQELTLVFTFIEDAAILKIRDWNGNDEISVRITVPELIVPEKNPNNQLIQAVGANATYLKRYLLVNTFLIMEEELIDSDNTEEAPASSAKTSGDKPVADIDINELIKKATETLQKKGLSDAEITPKAVKRQVMTMVNTPPERRAVNNYFKDLKEGSK